MYNYIRRNCNSYLNTHATGEFMKRVRKISSQLFITLYTLSIYLHTNSWDYLSRTLFVNSPVYTIYIILVNLHLLKKKKRISVNLSYQIYINQSINQYIYIQSGSNRTEQFLTSFEYSLFHIKGIFGVTIVFYF